jgi:P27 family predicted phage terminase small subunit
VLQGNPQKRRMPSGEPAATVPPELPQPPAFITGYALDEWRRVTPELYHMRLLANADLKVLEAYCISYGRWREAEEALEFYRRKDAITHGIIVKGAGGTPILNPLIKAARNAALDMLRFAIEFGFTPAARSRIVTGATEIPGSKFGDLLA